MDNIKIGKDFAKMGNEFKSEADNKKPKDLSWFTVKNEFHLPSVLTSRGLAR